MLHFSFESECLRRRRRWRRRLPHSLRRSFVAAGRPPDSHVAIELEARADRSQAGPGVLNGRDRSFLRSSTRRFVELSTFTTNKGSVTTGSMLVVSAAHLRV